MQEDQNVKLIITKPILDKLFPEGSEINIELRKNVTLAMIDNIFKTSDGSYPKVLSDLFKDKVFLKKFLRTEPVQQSINKLLADIIASDEMAEHLSESLNEQFKLHCEEYDKKIKRVLDEQLGNIEYRVDRCINNYIAKNVNMVELLKKI